MNLQRRTTMRRRRARIYTLGYLLSRQPKTLRKHPDFGRMMDRYTASPRLQLVRFSRRCYSLLQRATVRPENLPFFYRTYRLPADPFFALFFSIKRDYFAEREQQKEARRQYILARMRNLPPATLSVVKYLGYLERHYHSTGRSPLWQTALFPRSKRAADRLGTLSNAEWIDLFRRHLAALAERYPAMTPTVRERVLACFVLEIAPSGFPPGRPAAASVNRAYRRLSLVHHPDRGGNAAMFIELKRARDVLAR